MHTCSHHSYQPDADQTAFVAAMDTANARAQHSYFTQLPVIILVVGVLLAVGAMLGRLGRFVGVPAGLLFLAVGMLVGEGGLLGVQFNDYDLTYAVGTAALGLILFHGGLHTSVDTLKCAWKPAATLATVGVIGVTALTALGLWWATDYTLMA